MSAQQSTSSVDVSPQQLAAAMSKSADKIEMAMPRLLLLLRRSGGLFTMTLRHPRA